MTFLLPRARAAAAGSPVLCEQTERDAAVAAALGFIETSAAHNAQGPRRFGPRAPRSRVRARPMIDWTQFICNCACACARASTEELGLGADEAMRPRRRDAERCAAAAAV